MPETCEDGLKRQPPDVNALFCVLGEAGVKYVATGSAAAMLHGVRLVPGDLDITPTLDVDNLTRLAAVLESIEARHDPSAAFGHWERGDDGGATPDSRITRPMTEPRVSRCQRERRVAPMTI